jgi:hypothetical protein
MRLNDKINDADDTTTTTATTTTAAATLTEVKLSRYAM